MYKNIYFDYYHNKMILWENVNGSNLKDNIDIEYEYYIKDKTGDSNIKDIYGVPMNKRIVKSKSEIKQVVESNEYCAETDIPEEIKFLQKRYKNQDLKCNINLFNIAYLDIEVASENVFPKANEAKFPINLISFKTSKNNETYIFATQKYTGKENYANYFYFETEQRMLSEFTSFFKKQEIDIITGWNIGNFDIAYIINRCNILGIMKNLSPINKIIENPKTKEYRIAGLTILDYMELYKKFEANSRESYSLHYISKLELGEGKLEFEGTINDLYKRDWNSFVEYNVNDVLLVEKLDKKLKYIELTITLCYQSLIPFEKVFSSISILTGFIIKYLHKKNMVLPNKLNNIQEEYPGAFVYAKEGIFKLVVSFDFESLYPSIIRSWNISNETILNKKQYKLIIDNKEKLVYDDDFINVKRENGEIEEILIKNLQKTDEIIINNK